MSTVDGSVTACAPKNNSFQYTIAGNTYTAKAVHLQKNLSGTTNIYLADNSLQDKLKVKIPGLSRIYTISYVLSGNVSPEVSGDFTLVNSPEEMKFFNFESQVDLGGNVSCKIHNLHKDAQGKVYCEAYSEEVVVGGLDKISLDSFSSLEKWNPEIKNKLDYFCKLKSPQLSYSSNKNGFTYVDTYIESDNVFDLKLGQTIHKTDQYSRLLNSVECSGNLKVNP